MHDVVDAEAGEDCEADGLGHAELPAQQNHAAEDAGADAQDGEDRGGRDDQVVRRHQQDNDDPWMDTKKIKFGI